MKIAIIGAMEEEIVGVRNNMSDVTEKEVFGDLFYLGKIGKHDIILTRSHVGLAAAASQLTSIVLTFNVDYFINLGVCGGFVKKNKPLDLIVARRCAYYDADATYFGSYEYGQIPGCPKYFECDDSLARGLEYERGDIVSGDKFVATRDQIDKQLSRINYLDPRCIDMESAAFSHVAYKYHKPIMIVRTISDIVDDENREEGQYDNMLEAACEKSCKFVLAILTR